MIDLLFHALGIPHPEGVDGLVLQALTTWRPVWTFRRG